MKLIVAQVTTDVVFMLLLLTLQFTILEVVIRSQLAPLGGQLSNSAARSARTSS
jgi:hypothetical protein